jgi:hypothetical protein
MSIPRHGVSKATPTSRAAIVSLVTLAIMVVWVVTWVHLLGQWYQAHAAGPVVYGLIVGVIGTFLGLGVGLISLAFALTKPGRSRHLGYASLLLYMVAAALAWLFAARPEIL